MDIIGAPLVDLGLEDSELNKTGPPLLDLGDLRMDMNGPSGKDLDLIDSK